MRAVYDELIQNPTQIEKTLKMGAEKARAVATPFTARLRHAVGLRPLDNLADTRQAHKTAKLAAPSFKQYREADGLFYFKLMDAKGQLLLQSTGFASPKEAAQTMASLQKNGLSAVAEHQSQLRLEADTEAITQALNHFSETAN
jgi:tryptophanyl-tRNA synthetase